ncbi:MAG: aldehyde dehydrogenase family protein [Gammaproteobacteria bacterium]
MKPVLLLVDLQNDFLSSDGLFPPSELVVRRAARLLEGCRRRGIPVVHVWTTIDAAQDQRMPHWKTKDKWICVKETLGHRPPEELSPLKGENVVHKTVFSPFVDSGLDAVLERLNAGRLFIAGVHLHACVKLTALDAYQRGYETLIVSDATAGDEPVYGAITRRYLSNRGIRFITVEESLHELDSAGASSAADGYIRYNPSDLASALWLQRTSPPEAVGEACRAAKIAQDEWKRTDPGRRIVYLERFSGLLEKSAGLLTGQIATDIGKPATLAAAEIEQCVKSIRSVCRHAREFYEPLPAEKHPVSYKPLGVVALVTPWNNPVFIPAAKFAAALAYGNTVVWKPAQEGSRIAGTLLSLLQKTGAPDRVLSLVHGDGETAVGLMSDTAVNAVSITGAAAAGLSAQEICAKRHIPLQAELGGNNAAIVWRGCDIELAAKKIAEGAFHFSGQRCTANRRAIVDAACYGQFLEALLDSTAKLKWGDPFDQETRIGPMVSGRACARIAELVAAARNSGLDVFTPHLESGLPVPDRNGAYHPPVIVRCDRPEHEIVREESFGPVLVVQKAVNWDRAIELLNGTGYGLAAALFTDDCRLKRDFEDRAEAGILKFNLSTAEADASLPFGGWKASAVGPFEHGIADRLFYLRMQVRYGD